MEKRVLIAVALSFVVLYAFQALYPPPKPTPPAATEKATDAPAATKAPAPPTSVQAEATAAAPEHPRSATVVGDAAEKTVVVDNSAVRAEFSSRGAVLKHWQLKGYLDAGGKPLELVPQDVPPGHAKPFSLATPDAAVNEVINSAVYHPNRDDLRLGSAPDRVIFDFQDASGLSVRKEFEFNPAQPYVLAFSARVSKGTEIVPAVQWGPSIGNGRVENTRTYNPSSQPVFFRDGKVTRVKPTKIAEYAAQDAAFGFAGVDDHYFLTAALSGGEPLHLEYGPLEVPLPAQGSAQPAAAHFVEWSIRYAGSPSGARFFLGPKDFDVLRAIDPALTYAIDFGWFRWFVVQLLIALQWIHGFIGNYGWSIISLTVIINLAMFPLRHRSVVSMRKMQEIQPEMKAIQDRYAKLKMSDPARQKMNVELMNLYRERGVNPASGCVPMLLTLPVLFAFYSMLSVAIELRGAPFVGWIRDLSVHDPLFITPVLMGLTQFVQAKMTPSTADPAQQRMMLFMPLIFMTMFIWAPSGLVLYWTTSNLWAIGQQVVTNRMIGPGAAPVRPAAERRLKNVGAGRTEAVKERK
jgi:YidC/Oxa1 family membrane protein insertase